MLSVKIYSVPRRGGDTPLYKGCLRRYGLKTGIHFARFGLETGIVFEGTMVVYERINHLNSK